MLSKILFAFTILTAIACYHIYNEYVPPNTADPIALKTFLALNRFTVYTIGLLARFGVVDYTHARRYVIDGNAKLLKTSDPDIETEDTTIAGIAVRIYRPRSLSVSSPAPGMVYYHGGGWAMCSLDTHDSIAMMFAKEANIVVVSVDYRLSPEYSQRDGLDDCVAVTKSFLTNAAEYGVDPKRVVVAGDSAGGNYAATVSLTLRDQNFRPMPKLQLLIYPVTQAIDLMLPSYQQYDDGPFLTKEDMCYFLSQATTKNVDHTRYFDTNTHVPSDVRLSMGRGVLNHDLVRKENKYQPYRTPNYESGQSEMWDELADLLLDPYLFPLMADDLSDLPDAYVFTAQHDPLRDEGQLYVKRLRDDGVTVTHYNSHVGWHAMINFVSFFTDSRNVMMKMVQFLKTNL